MLAWNVYSSCLVTDMMAMCSTHEDWQQRNFSHQSCRVCLERHISSQMRAAGVDSKSDMPVLWLVHWARESEFNSLTHICHSILIRPASHVLANNRDSFRVSFVQKKVQRWTVAAEDQTCIDDKQATMTHLYYQHVPTWDSAVGDILMRITCEKSG